MSRKGKLLARFLSQPKDFTWEEFVRVLKFFGFSEMKTGKTGGSRRKFTNTRKDVLSFHKPHP
ncbi:MAG TPA: type II toxin-antitoxin system HicA family toxin, partial [Sphingomonadales bacterium]|nr:type II toxin-antitoxin system HicA family toxin [Sphingomonadales bacterium]